MPLPHHMAFYNGKIVHMDYVGDPKDEFRRACQRIADNGAEGHVITPKAEVYAVTKSSRRAKLVTGEESDRVRASVLLLLDTTL